MQATVNKTRFYGYDQLGQWGKYVLSIITTIIYLLTNFFRPPCFRKVK